jgi:2-polyprenyl-6-methoxyphenol hydroxylase-like FAD-dependent oxidoreductase
MLRGQIAYREGEDAGRFEMSLPDDVPYRGVCLPQYESERILGEHVASFGPVVERGSELTGLSQDDGGVTATILRDGAETAVRAKYLVGCDGAHSLVRKQVGLAFEGDAFEGAYMLADVEVDCSFPPGYAIRASRRSHDGKEDGLVCIPLPGRNRYRISWSRRRSSPRRSRRAARSRTAWRAAPAPSCTTSRR